MPDIQVLRDIYKTLKSTIRIHATPNFDNPLEIWESQFSGIPYFPKNMEYPKDSNGKPLYLLAQINLVDLPYLPFFPKEGLLQFYIGSDEHYGMNFNDITDQSGFKVIHVPHPNESNDAFHPYNFKQNQSELSFLKKPDYFPIDYPHRLQFQMSSMVLPESNPNFYNVYAKYLENDTKEPTFIDLYSILISSDCPFRMGGHISFLAENLYDIIKNIDDYEMLLQINHSKYISFGDDGTAIFLIKRSDLLKQDFSKVLFYWQDN